MRKIIACSTLVLFIFGGSSVAETDSYRPVQKLLDLSGLAWLGDDRFLAVHDAKNPDEPYRTRVSFLKTPTSLDGIMWLPLEVSFPGGASSDLESASRVPDEDLVLLVESNDDASTFRRVFLSRFSEDSVEVEASTEWTSFSDAYNVEATAVAKVEDGYLFLWAERNSGEASTKIQWSQMSLSPFEIGAPIGSVDFKLDDRFADVDGQPLYSRIVVGMDVDEAGSIYTVAAYDPEGTVKDPDNGPFRSAVIWIGSVNDTGVALLPNPEILGTVDGFKTESVVAVKRDDATWIFIGTDDENYGGTLRLLPF